MRLLILADDFTGALDTGVQFSMQNIPTTVVVSVQDTAACPQTGCEVLSVNLESRHLSEQDAYTLTKRMLKKYAQPGHYVYIKTDSALRGNIGAACAAALDVFGAPLCFVPALPALGRTTKDGICYVDGQPLAQSVFRNDPRTPVTKSDIRDILKNSVSDFSCRSVPFDALEDFDRIRTQAPADLYLFDCENDAQMTAIGNALAARHLYGLCAGCAGFATTFDAHIPFLKRQPLHRKQPGPLLLVSGSANAVTLAQLASAKENGLPVLSLSAPIHEAYVQGTLPAPASMDAAQKALALLRSGRSVILATAVSDAELHSIDDIAFHETVANTTASLVQYLIEEAVPNTLAVFGGDMVAAILKKLACASVDACGEIAPSVPVCTFSRGGRVHTLVTKSGGFGDADVIMKIIRHFN